MRVLELTSKLTLLISSPCSWTTESGYMKIKPCQRLWLVSLDKCLAQIEMPAPSQLPEHIVGESRNPQRLYVM